MRIPGSCRRIGWLAAAAGAIAAAMAMPAGAAATLVVDDDGGQCPSAPYTAIDDALADAAPGDTIVVCPGSYDAATIDVRVTLRGFTPDLSKASNCADVDAQNPDVDTIVAGLDVGSSFVTITGFTVAGSGADGIHVPGGTRTIGLTRNVIEENVRGINLNGASVVVDHSCIRDNETGIYSDQGLTSSTITSNAFVGNNGGDAITLIGNSPGPVSGVRVDHNSSAGDDDLISLIATTNTTVSNNTVTGAAGSAIYVQDSNAGLTITKNTLSDGLAEGIAINAGGLTPSTTLTVSSNKVKSNAGFGIVAAPSSLDGSTFEKNTVSGNGGGGLVLAADVNGNLLEKNTLKGNTGYDCYDDPANVNTWSKDKGKTQNRTGLCKGAKVV